LDSLSAGISELTQDNDEIYALSERFSGPPSYAFMYAGVTSYDPNTGSYNTDTNSNGASGAVLARNDSLWLNVDTPLNVYDKATGNIAELFPVDYTVGVFNDAIDRFYFQRTDYSAMGDLLITDGTGTRIDSFSTDISGEAGIHFIDTVMASVGSDKTICASDSLVQVNGSSTTGDGYWISSGSGSYISSNQSSTYYNPSNGDTANGSVQLSYVTKDTGRFQPDTATLTVTFIPLPEVSTAPDIDTTVNIDSVAISGTISGAWTDLQWSSYGNGSFTDVNMLSTFYKPAQGDKNAGSVNLLLTATNNGQCPQDDVLNLNFTDTDIPEHDGSELSMELHPVPAGQELFVTLPGEGAQEVDYELIDLTGRTISEGDLDRGTRQAIDIEGLERGTYFLRVRTEEDQLVRKWVKR
jgi:hypothetical protein